MTIKTDSYVIGSNADDTRNFLLDTDLAGALRIRRKSDGSGGTVLNAGANDNVQKMVLLAAKATTSGTLIDFLPADGVPSWAKEITLMFNGFSTSGSSVPQIRLGSGSVDATGYSQANGQVVNAGATVISNNPTTGFGLNGNAWSSSVVITGQIDLRLMNPSTNLWVVSGVLGRTDSAGIELLGGSKTLSGPLDRIRITTVNGTDTLTGGSVNLLIKGY